MLLTYFPCMQQNLACCTGMTYMTISQIYRTSQAENRAHPGTASTLRTCSSGVMPWV